MKDKNGFAAVVCVGTVGHCQIDDLAKIKRIIETIEGFDLVFFKTSSEKLWIKEGDAPDDNR